MNDTIQPQQFDRKPFSVEAVQVTAENMNLVALWCRGAIQLDSRTDKGIPVQVPFISLRVSNAANVRQTQGFVGDWITKSGRIFKIYTNASFWATFNVQPQIKGVEAVLSYVDELTPVDRNPFSVNTDPKMVIPKPRVANENIVSGKSQAAMSDQFTVDDSPTVVRSTN